jgi:hypothetical protein
MRILLLPVLLAFAPVALAQSNGTVRAPFEHSWKGPMAAAQPRDFSKLAPDWRFTEPSFVHKRLQESTTPDSQLDSKMVVHPPKESLGEQQPGTLIAENVYPDLEVLPITAATGIALPIATSWPNLKVENIPTASPKCAVLPVQKLALSPANQK